MSTEGPFGYATSSTQRSRTAFNFVLDSGSGTTPSPLNIVNSDGSARLSLAVNAAQSASISVVASVPNAAAALTLGPASSTGAVTISNSAATDILQVGRAGVAGIQLSSAAVAGGAMSIVGDNANALNTISIGPNTNAPSCVTVGPGNAFVVTASPYTTQTVVPQLANGTGTIPGASGVVLTNPATPGLYLIAASCSSLDGPSVASQLSTVAMWNGTTWKTGGVIETPNGTGTVSFSPAPGTAATMNFFNNSGGNLINMSFIKFPLFNGLINGMP